MRPIDADVLEKELAHECVSLRGDNTRKTFYRAIKIVRQQPTVTTPPNDPLTLEELREMDGDAVWVVCDEQAVHTTPGSKPLMFQALIEVWEGSVFLTNNRGGRTEYAADEELEANGITLYRRKPEEASRMKHVCAATGGPCCWCNPGPCNSRKPEEGGVT